MWVRGTEAKYSKPGTAWHAERPDAPRGAPVRLGTGPHIRHQFQVPVPAAPHLVLPSQQTRLLKLSLPTPGCLAEQWSGKKGDTAALGGKKAKKKSSRTKAAGSGSSKQRKELGGLQGDPSPEEDEGVQKASPLTHSPPDEL